MEKKASPLSQIEPPQTLQKLQRWFAHLITTPLNREEKIALMTGKGTLIAKEATRFVKKSTSQLPHERMQIYNQQYWWRLFKTLQATFPFLLSVVGFDYFNEKIAKPYLLKHPPDSWSINGLGKQLPYWMETSYRGVDAMHLVPIAHMDWVFVEALVRPSLPPLIIPKEPEKLALLFETPLFLQPHVYLFQWEHDWIDIRQIFLKQPPQKGLRDLSAFLSKKNPQFIILFRHSDHYLMGKAISPAHWHLLQLFQQGCCIAEACAQMEQHHPLLCDEVHAHLQTWIPLWIQNGWLSLHASAAY